MIDVLMAERAKMVAAGVSLGVYAAASWLGARVLGTPFWWIFGGLIGLRVFFGTLESISGIVNWRIFRRQEAIDGFVRVLQVNNFPPRRYQHDQILAYLCRIKDGPYPEPLKRAATEFETTLELAEVSGILAGARLYAAAEAALERYSPRSDAPAYGRDIAER